MTLTILFGMDRGVPLWFCLLLPLCIAGMKLFAAAVTLWDYEKRGFGYNENKQRCLPRTPFGFAAYRKY